MKDLFPITTALKSALDKINRRFDCKKNSPMEGSEEIVLHYPLVTIRNSSGDQHDIRDLFVKITINEGTLQFEGTRSSLSFEEFQWRYAHSHLNLFQFDSFSKFCLGNAPLLAYDINETDENVMVGFIYCLDEYLSWESLEGGPYHLISKLSSYTKTTKSMCEFVNLPFDATNVKFNIVNQKYSSKIIIDRNHLASILPKTCLLGNDGSVYQDTIKDDVDKEDAINYLELYKEDYIMFQDKKYFLNFYDLVEKEVIQEKTYVHHPGIINYYENKYRKQIEQYLHHNDVIPKLQTEYSQTRVESNSILV